MKKTNKINHKNQPHTQRLKAILKGSSRDSFKVAEEDKLWLGSKPRGKELIEPNDG